MTRVDYGNGAKKGKLLARGKGAWNMLDVSYRNGYTNDNTILVVDNADTLDSTWRIYEKKGE